MPKVAKTVVLRPEEYIFDVDGKPFPWWLPRMPEDAELPRATKIWDNLYSVRLTFFAILRGQESTPMQFETTEWQQPIICGVEFPWWISTDGFTFTVRNGEVSTVELEFFAETVEGMEVDDSTFEDEKVREVGGYVIGKAAA